MTVDRICAGSVVCDVSLRAGTSSAASIACIRRSQHAGRGRQDISRRSIRVVNSTLRLIENVCSLIWFSSRFGRTLLFARSCSSPPTSPLAASNSPPNDPQLQIPSDQAQSCFTPEGSRSDYEQFQQFDSFPQPASKGYLCINIPSGRTFIVDHLFAEADYDAALPADAEWYLDSVAGGYDLMTGFAAARLGSATANPH